MTLLWLQYLDSSFILHSSTSDVKMKTLKIKTVYNMSFVSLKTMIKGMEDNPHLICLQPANDIIQRASDPHQICLPEPPISTAATAISAISSSSFSSSSFSSLSLDSINSKLSADLNPLKISLNPDIQHNIILENGNKKGTVKI